MGAPGWFSKLSIQLLISAQVLISGSRVLNLLNPLSHPGAPRVLNLVLEKSAQCEAYLKKNPYVVQRRKEKRNLKER